MTPDIAQLDRFVGSYSVSGTTPDGKAYRGTMAVQRHGAFLHTEAKLDALGARFGLAMPWAGRLVMAFGAKDKVEIGAYRIEGENVVGLWVPPGARDDDFGKCGREESVLESQELFRITKAYAVDQSAYSGTVRLNPGLPPGAKGNVDTARAVRMTWNLHDGNYHSFAIAYADAVYSTFNLASGEGHGIAVYTVAGDVLNGLWLNNESMKLGEEMLRR